MGTIDMPRRPAAPDTVMAGIALMSVAMVVVPLMDAIAKYLGQTLPPLEVAVARFVFQTLSALAAALVMRQRLALLPRPLLRHALRGATLAGATLCWFTAVTRMPLADGLAIFFIEPMVLTGLSALLLGEKVGPRRWAAVVVGFLGALLIIRPGWSLFGVHAILPAVSAVFFAFYLILTRSLAGTASALSMMASAGISGAVVLVVALLVTSLAGIPGWTATMPAPVEWPLLASVGIISFATHLLVVMAFARAPAAVLAPLNYVEIVSATALGFLMFGDFPAPVTWIGIALIVASGLYIAHRERRARAHEVRQTAAADAAEPAGGAVIDRDAP
ncbi:MAG: DMT family transporter [Hyphomicrobiales bacterium]